MNTYNTNTPSISIITIVYNGLPYLKECVASVLNQQYQDWELLISDDCSTDGSREFLDTLCDDRIMVVKQEKNLGIFGNLNFLFKLARAPLTQILCQDDYFVNASSLSRIVEYWKTASPKVGFVRFNHYSSKLKQLEAYQLQIVPPTIKSGNADIWFYTFGNIPGNLSNVSLRTAIVEECGWFNQNHPYSGDMEFWSRAARKFDMGIENDFVVYVRSHPGQASKYLNFNGELVSQQNEIINNLYEILYHKYPDKKIALKLHGTLQYDTLQRDAAVKGLIKGNFKYIKELFRSQKKAKYVLSVIGKWFVYSFSVGGRIGRVSSAKYLLDKINL